MQHTLCIYHANCPDGLASALAVHVYLKEQGSLNFSEFLPVAYGDDPPDVSGKNVVMVDFSYKRETLLEMEMTAEAIVVIDHHKTAQDQLGDLDFAIFDMAKSGCVLTWEYLFPHTPVPILFYYVQDRDLWQWKLPNSREVSAALRSYEPKLEVWEDFQTPAAVEKLKSEGIAILRYQNGCVDASLSNDIEMMEIGGHIVPILNCTHLISEVGNALAGGYPFAAMYFDVGSPNPKRVFSLRSTDDGIDVSAIAKLYGGGGHPRAAGFSVSRPPVLTKS